MYLLESDLAPFQHYRTKLDDALREEYPPLEFAFDVFEVYRDRVIERTRMAATQLEISGTPGLVIGSQVIPGAISLEQMRDIVAAERASNG